MNWLDDKGTILRSFCDENNLKNFVTKPTRVAQRKNYSSSTLIYVIFHNGSNIDNVHVLDFPYSDHSIVMAECKFGSLDNSSNLSLTKFK